MELKDVILSTLAEMEEGTQTLEHNIQEPHAVQKEEAVVQEHSESMEKPHPSENELYFLHSIRERLLVLFEGFQAPNNANIEAKIDMTLNFLEYTLATIDDRIEKLEKGNRA